MSGLLWASCGGGARPDNLPATAPISVGEHIAEVHHHEDEVELYEGGFQHEMSSRGIRGCISPIPTSDPSSAKGVAGYYGPCWTFPDGDRPWQLDEIRENRKFANKHRKRAKQLLEAEKEACSRLRKEDILLSPSYHREDIVGVDDYKEKGRLRGAIVTFRSVPGLSGTWMHAALRCHQNRAAVMGYDEDFQAYCPGSIRGVAISVVENEKEIVVTFRTNEPDAAILVSERAHKLLVASE